MRKSSFNFTTRGIDITYAGGDTRTEDLDKHQKGRKEIKLAIAEAMENVGHAISSGRKEGRGKGKIIRDYFGEPIERPALPRTDETDSHSRHMSIMRARHFPIKRQEKAGLLGDHALTSKPDFDIRMPEIEKEEKPLSPSERRQRKLGADTLG